MSKRLARLLRETKSDLSVQTELAQFDVSIKLREELNRRSINQAQLAQKLGVSEAAVSKLLKGGQNHTISKLVEVANTLDLELKIEFVKREQPAQGVRIAQVLNFQIERSFALSRGNNVPPLRYEGFGVKKVSANEGAYELEPAAA